jgi:sporulation protein YlmC with PRC-barrel domain
MFRTYAAAGLLGAALISSGAFAQTPTPRSDSMAPTSSMATQSHQGMWRASKLIGVNVYNDNNESLGSINDLIVDNSGSIKTAIIGVGGFLGVGERYIAVNFDKLKWSNEPVKTAATTTTSPPAGNMSTSGTVGSAGTTSTTSTSSGSTWYPDHAVLSASKDEVKSMPEFKY